MAEPSIGLDALAAVLKNFEDQRKKDMSMLEKQRKAELKELEDQRKAELMSLEEQRKAELISLEEQRKAELKSLEEQRKEELRSLEEQRQLEMQRHRAEMDLIVQKLAGTAPIALNVSAEGSDFNTSFTRKSQKEYALLSDRIAEFEYDPESPIDFTVWMNRHSHILEKDGVDFEESVKVKLILEKLSPRIFEIYRKFKLPKNVYEVSYKESIETLKSLFSSKVTKTASRMMCLHMTHRVSESLAEYTGRISELFDAADFSDLSSENWKCLLWIFGLKDRKQVMVKHHLLNVLDRMESNKEICTVQLLHAEYEKFEKQRAEREMFMFQADKAEANPDLVSRSYDCNVVKYRKSSKNGVEASDSKESGPCYNSYQNTVCFNCDSPGHLSRQCKLRKSHCSKCNREGHLAKYCQKRAEFIQKKLDKEKELQNIARVNTLRVQNDSASDISRPCMTVKVNDVEVVFRVDIGSDITLISRNDWLKIGAPVLSKTTKYIRNASDKELKVFGEVLVNFETSHSSGKVLAYVASTESLLGLDWIRQCEHMSYHLKKMGSSASRESTVKSNVENKVVEELFSESEFVKSIRSDSQSMLTVGNNSLKSVSSENKHRRIPKRFFRVGEEVYSKVFQSGKVYWTTSVVKEKIGHVRYIVQQNDEKVVKRHVNELERKIPRNRRQYLARPTMPKPESAATRQPAAAVSQLAAASQPAAEDTLAEKSLSTPKSSYLNVSRPSIRRHRARDVSISAPSRSHRSKGREVLCGNKEYKFHVIDIGISE